MGRAAKCVYSTDTIFTLPHNGVDYPGAYLGHMHSWGLPVDSYNRPTTYHKTDFVYSFRNKQYSARNVFMVQLFERVTGRCRFTQPYGHVWSRDFLLHYREMPFHLSL